MVNVILAATHSNPFTTSALRRENAFARLPQQKNVPTIALPPLAP